MPTKKKEATPVVVEFDIPELDEILQATDKLEKAKYLKAEAHDFIEQKHQWDLKVEDIKELQAKNAAAIRAKLAEQEERIGSRKAMIEQRMHSLHNPLLAEAAIEAGRFSKKAGDTYIANLAGKRALAIKNDRARIEMEYKYFLDPLAQERDRLAREYRDAVAAKKEASRNADAKFAALNVALT